MAIHVFTVHGETITNVPNAKDERNTLDLLIYGMDGIPAKDLERYNDMVNERSLKKQNVGEILSYTFDSASSAQPPLSAAVKMVAPRNSEPVKMMYHNGPLSQVSHSLSGASHLPPMAFGMPFGFPLPNWPLPPMPPTLLGVNPLSEQDGNDLDTAPLTDVTAQGDEASEIFPTQKYRQVMVYSDEMESMEEKRAKYSLPSQR